MRQLLLITAACGLFCALAPTAAAQSAGYAGEGTIVVTPPTPSPGDEITVTVTGCSPAPGEVDVLIDNVLVGRAQVDPDGSFQQDFVVPLESQGQVTVEVRCDTEVLASIVDVQVAPAPFQQDNLPQTGNETQPLLQAAAILIGLGFLFLVVSRRDREPQGRHARLPGEPELGEPVHG